MRPGHSITNHALGNTRGRMPTCWVMARYFAGQLFGLRQDWGPRLAPRRGIPSSPGPWSCDRACRSYLSCYYLTHLKTAPFPDFRQHKTSAGVGKVRVVPKNPRGNSHTKTDRASPRYSGGTKYHIPLAVSSRLACLDAETGLESLFLKGLSISPPPLPR